MKDFIVPLIVSCSLLLTGCGSTPQTFIDYESKFNKVHSGLSQLKAQGFHIHFSRYQPEDRQGNYRGHAFGGFSLSFNEGDKNYTRDLINLELLDMPLTFCHTVWGNSDRLVCGSNSRGISDLQVFLNYLAKHLEVDSYKFLNVYRALDKIDANLAKLSETDRKKWLSALVEQNPSSYTFQYLLKVLDDQADKNTEQMLSYIADNEVRKKQLELKRKKDAEIAKQKKLERTRAHVARLEEQRRKERAREIGLAKAKELINDPNMIGHKFCRDGELKYIGLVNRFGRPDWGNIGESGQMQATLEGLSPDRTKAKMRSIGYAIHSGTLEYKSDTTPSLDGLSFASGQVFWDDKKYWYSCPN